MKQTFDVEQPGGLFEPASREAGSAALGRACPSARGEVQAQ